MKNIYDKRRLWKFVFFAAAVIIAVCFLYISNRLVEDLSKQERERMEIWANATKELATSTNFSSSSSTQYIDFLLSIIETNYTIPVMLCDNKDQIILQRNFNLPEPIDSMMPTQISKANDAFLKDKLKELKNSSNIITIQIDDNTIQYLYYEDSTILKRLSYYPYVQLFVMLIFILIVYFAVISMKKAEQNKVWVGLSKETAHQLGTPISSLMAWMQILESCGVDKEMVNDMDTDVKRLSVIADRFSKIGSIPELELHYLNEAVTKSLAYMKSRISKRVNLTLHLSDNEIPVNICSSLFEWVMENLTKNAVDAMQGVGSIDVYISQEKEHAIIDITDTGKGIARKNFKAVFNPGFTTKKRGWGLGLTLVKRIIESYHGGKIFIKDSEIGKGTTFRIEIPVLK